MVTEGGFRKEESGKLLDYQHSAHSPEREGSRRPEDDDGNQQPGVETPT